MRFDLGKIYTSRGVFLQYSDNDAFAKFIADSLERYVKCDWGDMDPEDKQANDEAVEAGDRILAAYNDDKSGIKIWIITEADRSVTTVLLPDEY